jgi:folate-binding protein YgfZ
MSLDENRESAARDDNSPPHFGNPREEYAAAVGSAAVFDWGNPAQIEITGADRVRFLHGFCTNDIKRLQAGQGCEAFITNVKGRILGHVWIDIGPSSIWLDAGPVAADRLVAHLDRYIINEDVTIADRTQETDAFLVMGPDAAAKVATALGDVARLGALEHKDFAHGSGSVRVCRRDVGAQPAYVVRAARTTMPELWEALRQSGARPAGSAVWSALRIEAGLPIYGVDLTEENLAQEAARTQTAISFTKGCYLGQEPIARIDAMGHVNRELRSLRIASETVSTAGASVFSDRDGSTAVGTVTSAAFSFGSHSAVALAVLRTNAGAPGNQVFVKTDTALSPASVFWFPGERLP